MSKSRGVFVEPMQLVDQFGSDAVRWVLLSEVPFDRDGDFSMAKFVDRYNADLANDYGNLVSRTTKMVQRYFDGRVPAMAARDRHRRRAAHHRGAGGAGVRRGHGRAAVQRGHGGGAPAGGAGQQVHRGDRPWTLHREGDPRLGTVCAELLEAVRVSTMLLHPVIPRATARVAAEMGISLDGDLSEELRRWPALAEGVADQRSGRSSSRGSTARSCSPRG